MTRPGTGFIVVTLPDGTRTAILDPPPLPESMLSPAQRPTVRFAASVARDLCDAARRMELFSDDELTAIQTAMAEGAVALVDEAEQRAGHQVWKEAGAELARREQSA